MKENGKNLHIEKKKHNFDQLLSSFLHIASSLARSLASLFLPTSIECTFEREREREREGGEQKSKNGRWLTVIIIFTVKCLEFT